MAVARAALLQALVFVLLIGAVSWVVQPPVRQRILATSNVAQLTGVMKLVAASKLKGVETRLMAGRPFGEGLMNSVSFKIEVDPEHPDYNPDVATAEPKKVMFMVVTTDRGLCGGVNSQIIRAARTEYKRYTDAGHDCSVRDSPACQRCGCVVPALHPLTCALAARCLSSARRAAAACSARTPTPWCASWTVRLTRT